jgi:hypothetical protein
VSDEHAREPGGGELDKRRRNLAILLVVFGLFGMAGAALGLAVLEAGRGRSREYRGVQELESSPPAESRPAEAPTEAPVEPPRGDGSR